MNADPHSGEISSKRDDEKTDRRGTHQAARSDTQGKVDRTYQREKHKLGIKEMREHTMREETYSKNFNG